MAAATPEKQLESFIDKFTPEVAALGRRVLGRVRKRLPGAVELVYDNTYALVVGFGPTEKASEAVFSVVFYPRWVLLYFLQGATLPDPERKLQGKGKVGRHLRLYDDAPLDDPAVQMLIDDAVELAEAPFDAKQKRKVVIKLEAQKQRPRRPAARATKC